MRRPAPAGEIVDNGEWPENADRPLPEPVVNEWTERNVAITPLGVAALRVMEFAANCVEIGGNCDSPIEQQLGAHILRYFEEHGQPLKLCKMIDLREATSELVLVPQYRWSIYRSDWAILRTNNHRQALLIECDGKDFHSSAAQREHDRKKDAAAHDYGHLTMRFTGSDIWGAPEWCASQVYQSVCG